MKNTQVIPPPQAPEVCNCEACLVRRNAPLRLPHTSGKWIFDEDQTPHKTGFGGGPLPFLVVITGSSETIHVCGNGTTNSRSDARLIASAPDLLEALRLCLVTLDGPLDKDFPLNLPRGAAQEKARAAIAKAEGR